METPALRVIKLLEICETNKNYTHTTKQGHKERSKPESEDFLHGVGYP